MDGIRYALGEGSPDIASRPLPLALGRIKKTVISPITKINADEFFLQPPAPEERTPTSPSKETAKAAKRRILDQAKARIEKADRAKKVALDAAKARATVSPPPPPQALNSKADMILKMFFLSYLFIFLIKLNLSSE